MGSGDGFNPNPDPFGMLSGSDDMPNTIGTADLNAEPAPEPPKPTPFYKTPAFIAAAVIMVAIAAWYTYKHFKKHGLKLKK
jgi:hypothetical protein